MGEPVSRQKVEERQLSFDGGLNTVSDLSALGPNQFRRSLNARIAEYGGITKRNGSVIKTDVNVGEIVDGLFLWNKDDATSETLAVSDGHLFTNPDIEDGEYPWDDEGAISSSGDASPGSVFQKFRNSSGDIVYIAAGGFLNSWDGATLDASVTSVDVTTIRVHNQRLWGAGDPDFPNTLFYSGLNDGDTIADTGGGGGEIIVRTFGSSRIVGLASVGTSLLIFHERGISRVTGFGQDDTTVEPQAITADTGLIAPNSIVEVDGGVFFVSDRGVYFATEGGVRRIGTADRPDPIQPLLSSDAYTEAYDTGLSIRGCFRRATNEIIFLVPGYGAFVYNLVLSAWVGPWTGEWLDVTCLTTGSPEQTTLERLITGFSNGACRYSDDQRSRRDGADLSVIGSGEPIEWLVGFRRFFLGDESTVKAYRHGYLTALLPSSSTLEVSWRTDNREYSYSLAAPTGATWGRFVWGFFTWGRAGSKNFRIPMGGNGYFVDVTIACVDDGKPLVSRLMVEGFNLGRR